MPPPRAAYATAKPCGCGAGRAAVSSVEHRARLEACGCVEMGAQAQRWQVQTLSGRPPAPGEAVTLRALHRQACASHVAAAARHCASDEVQLSGDWRDARAAWTLVPGARLLACCGAGW